MNFSWTEEQTEFHERLKSFALEHLEDDVVGRDERSEFAESLWQRAAAFGIQGMSMPREFGGTDSADIQTAMYAMEGLGYGCRDGGLLLALNAQMWAVQLPILHFGTDHQKGRFLPKLCNGDWKGAHGITEPATGSDVFNMKTTATRVDGGYLLNGTKCMVTLAPVCDLALVVASTDPEKGKWGVSTFLVESSFEGFTRGENQLKMGLRTVPIGTIGSQRLLCSRVSSARERRRRVLDFQLLSGIRTLLHFSDAGWHDAAATRAMHSLCKGSGAIWASDWKVPISVQSHRRHEAAIGNFATDALQGGVAEEPGQVRDDGRRNLEAVPQRVLCKFERRRRANSRWTRLPL